MRIYYANSAVLAKLLNRSRKDRSAAYDVDLVSLLGEILTWANKFVPSEAGSILLDDPALKWNSRKEYRLYFAACFGKGSSTLVNTSISTGAGIAGETYRTGKPYISRDVRKDRNFYPAIAQRIRHKTSSIICAPVILNGAVIGVIELINRKGSLNYTREDLSLLKIFAGYTATLVLNALIARNFEELSQQDNLTGLSNDRHFFHLLEAETAKASATGADLSLIFFDLDHFKQVNDNFGHLAGSTVLKEVGDILREIFHGTQAVCARYGGDEYTVILPGCGRKDAALHAEHIRANIVNRIFLSDKVPGLNKPLNIKGVITCSIGVASFREHVKHTKNVRTMADAMIRAADSAMYRAKELGKNRIIIAMRQRDRR